MKIDLARTAKNRQSIFLSCAILFILCSGAFAAAFVVKPHDDQPLVSLPSFERNETETSLHYTGNAYDLAIGGKGYFVLTDGSSFFYTRNGRFHIDNKGFITHAGGYHLASVSALSASAYSIEVTTDGQIRAALLDGNLRFVAQLRLALPEPGATLTEVASEVYSMEGAEFMQFAMPGQDAGHLIQGCLETSQEVLP